MEYFHRVPPFLKHVVMFRGMETEQHLQGVGRSVWGVVKDLFLSLPTPTPYSLLIQEDAGRSRGSLIRPRDPPPPSLPHPLLCQNLLLLPHCLLSPLP